MTPFQMTVTPANSGSRHPGGSRGPVLKMCRNAKTRSESASAKLPCVYILASRCNGTLYVGVTSDLIGRVWQHQNDLVEGFTKRYGVHRLVWYETHQSMLAAIAREKAIKEWKQKWKLQLIESMNPHWRDLYADIT